VDTAGIRRQSKVEDRVEKFSVLRSKDAVERADVCVIMIDAKEGVPTVEKKVQNETANEQTGKDATTASYGDTVKFTLTGTLPDNYDDYDDYDEDDDNLSTDAERIMGKLKVVNSEQMQWFELALACAFALIAYMGPVWMMYFQKFMRKLEMENEVMQFQTIILMLMKIERVNVEMILEWLERYSNIYREPISKCVNNYEAGAWEALEELKNDVAFPQLIRIIESLQSAVEKIPIRQAFDELDTERAYYQEKRKESNERLISRKSLIGKVVGFAPMVAMFVGYLIAPLCVIGLLSMTEAFQNMSSQM